jgi:site-specific DNA-methyltransferase (adenine-specific)
VKEKAKAKRNRTLILEQGDIEKYSKKLISLRGKRSLKSVANTIINQDIFEALKYLPEGFVDLLFIDPPYNLQKSFNTINFKKRSIGEYSEWVDKLVSGIKRILKPNASIYFCSEWNSSTSVHLILTKYFKVRNRITWEREKGRGSQRNWKNNSEDIWFCTNGDDYIFNPDSVKLKRKVLAPYRTDDGKPKDWGAEGFRLTYPSNIWTDLTVPFWSMPENTEHPTQKPEKLLARLILANTNEGDFVFDPFLGSGTAAVAAKKLGRKFSGVEIDKEYACIAQKRLSCTKQNDKIQGIEDGVFWERNSIYSLNRNTKK